MNEPRLGAAFDVGTSKIEGALVDLDSGEVRALSAFPNRQLLYGSDVISRLNFALRDENNQKKLTSHLFESMDVVLKDLIEKAGITGHEVEEILCVGNSAMHHLALSIVPDRLARAPFRPSYGKEEFAEKADRMGITMSPDANFTFLPNLGGFVGSDALAVIISSGLNTSDTMSLVIDIGTNGEIALGSKEKIIVTSTSAGPAFEGWRISCGMPAVDGAIESISVKDDKSVSFTTIGGNVPTGVCGSALIDLLRNLLNLKVLDKSGKIENAKFKIHGDLYLTQEDVRELQLAKAAIQAAVKLLRARFERDVEKVFLTGRFGNCLSSENARAIGIIPKDISLDRVHFLEHGALEGARLLLYSREAREAARTLYQDIEHVSLHKEKNFQDEFVDAMQF